VLDLLLDRNKKAATTLVLVTHDPEVASRADRKIVLKDGMVVEDTLPFAEAKRVESTLFKNGETNG
jgi:putative ABC transport system ATP-binding protein